MFDGELVRFICNGFDGENIDYFYQDFDDSSCWSIICTEIVRFNSDQYYSFWSEVGLTEMQENEWYDQKPLIARQKKADVNLMYMGIRILIQSILWIIVMK